MNRWIRQVHRWLSIVFTIGVIANLINIFGMGQQQPAVWVGMMALIPLILLLLSGLYLFALPYVSRHDATRRTSHCQRPECRAADEHPPHDRRLTLVHDGSWRRG